MSKDRQPIILCATEKGRAVIYGYVDELPEPGEPVTLYDARMVLRWKGGGLFRLASEGPRDVDVITDEIPSTTETVWQEWVEASDDAALAWEEYGG